MVNPLATLGRDKLRIEKLENVAVPPNTERTLCNKTGPGVVRSLWMALGGGGAPALDARLRVYYDGSPTAAIDIDMGTLLATHWGAGSANTSHSCQHVHVVIREGFSFDLADSLLSALRSATDYLTANPPRTSTASHGFSHT